MNLSNKGRIRREWRHVDLALAVLMLGGGHGLDAQTGASPTPPPPPQVNIVLVMADDVSPDLFSCFDALTPHGAEASGHTPNVDRFVENGVVFKTAYASAMCAPSRVQIMTGKYGHTTGCLQNGIWMNDSKENVYRNHLAFGKMLHDAGYITAIAGKWHAGKQMPYEPEVGFDEYCLWEGPNEVLKITGSPLAKSACAWEDHRTPSRYWHPCLVRNGELLKTKPTDFGPDLCADFICNFIERQAKAGKPFLAYWPTVSPHGTRTGCPTNPLRGEPGDLGTRGDPDWTERWRSLNEHLDGTIGKVRDTIRRLGIEENTLLVFCSDNGTAVTAKTRGVERGCHVLFMAEGAGVKPRGFTDALMDFSDIAPTLAAFAGAELVQESPFDGIDLKPFLTGQTDRTKPLIYGFISTSQLVRSKDHLLEVFNPLLGVPAGRFYYTGENRFWQGYKRADTNPEHAKEKERFMALLEKYPPVTEDHPHWSTRNGKKFLENYAGEKERTKHLHNHRDYALYDETID